MLSRGGVTNSHITVLRVLYDFYFKAPPKSDFEKQLQVSMRLVTGLARGKSPERLRF